MWASRPDHRTRPRASEAAGDLTAAAADDGRHILGVFVDNAMSLVKRPAPDRAARRKAILAAAALEPVDGDPRAPRVRLTVTDDDGAVDSASTSVTIDPANQAPTANAGRGGAPRC